MRLRDHAWRDNVFEDSFGWNCETIFDVTMCLTILFNETVSNCEDVHFNETTTCHSVTCHTVFFKSVRMVRPRFIRMRSCYTVIDGHSLAILNVRTVQYFGVHFPHGYKPCLLVPIASRGRRGAMLTSMGSLSTCCFLALPGVAFTPIMLNALLTAKPILQFVATICTRVFRLRNVIIQGKF